MTSGKCLQSKPLKLLINRDLILKSTINLIYEILQLTKIENKKHDKKGQVLLTILRSRRYIKSKLGISYPSSIKI